MLLGQPPLSVPETVQGYVRAPVPVALSIENVFPVDEVMVTVQLSAVPLAALTYGFGGLPGAVRTEASIAARVAGVTDAYEPLLSVAMVSAAI